ncbi:MAG: enoyl-CoA hydratase, partial [Bacteroidetes bacterium]
FQVMEALMRVMPARAVLDWCLRGTDLPVAQALSYGLITHACPREAVGATVDQILAEVVAQSPAAIRLGLEAYDQLRRDPPANPQAYLQQMLLRCLQTPDAREGMQAFREGRPPVWS